MTSRRRSKDCDEIGDKDDTNRNAAKKRKSYNELPPEKKAEICLKKRERYHAKKKIASEVHSVVSSAVLSPSSCDIDLSGDSMPLTNFEAPLTSNVLSTGEGIENAPSSASPGIIQSSPHRKTSTSFVGHKDKHILGSSECRSDAPSVEATRQILSANPHEEASFLRRRNASINRVVSPSTEIDITTLKNIRDITDTTPTPWKVRVRVVEKAFARLSTSTPTKYQRAILGDEQGSKVQTTIFGEDIQTIGKRMDLLKEYYISNAFVRPILADHRIVQNEYQWIINKWTGIQPITDQQPVAHNPYSVVPFSNFGIYLNSQAQIDVLAVVLQLKPMKEVHTRNGLSKVQEMILVDKMLKPVTLTLWDQFVENECVAVAELKDKRSVIVATRLKVVAFNSLSLSTKTSSCLLINPDFPEANDMKLWSLENEEILQKLLNDSSYMQTVVRKVSEPPSKIVPLSEALQLSTSSTFWVKATVMVINFNQGFWYMSCDGCNRATSAGYNEVFKCNFCKDKEDSKGKPRYRIEVQLTDETDFAAANIFGEKAEDLLSCSAMDLMKETVQNGVINVVGMMDVYPKGEIYFLLKTNDYHRDRDSKKRFNVIEIYRESNMGQAKSLNEKPQQSIEKGPSSSKNL